MATTRTRKRKSSSTPRASAPEKFELPSGVSPLRERDHLEDCPGIEDVDTLEWWTATQVTERPNIPAGSKVRVIRCVKCGGQTEQAIDEED